MCVIYLEIYQGVTLTSSKLFWHCTIDTVNVVQFLCGVLHSWLTNSSQSPTSKKCCNKLLLTWLFSCSFNPFFNCQAVKTLLKSHHVFSASSLNPYFKVWWYSGGLAGDFRLNLPHGCLSVYLNTDVECWSNSAFMPAASLAHSVSLPRRLIQLLAVQHTVTLGEVHKAATWPRPSVTHLSPVVRWKNTEAINTGCTAEGGMGVGGVQACQAALTIISK